MADTWKPKSAIPYAPKSATPVEEDLPAPSLWDNVKSIATKVTKNPTVQRLWSGMADEDIAKRNAYDKLHPDNPAPRVVTPGFGEKSSLLPQIEHSPDESTLSWAGKGIYNNLIAPLGTPSGFMGAASPKKAGVLPTVEGGRGGMAPLEHSPWNPPIKPTKVSAEVPEPKSGTPVYNTPQFGLKPTDETLPYPLSVTPNRLRPPSTNATVFDALVPERYKLNEQGAARPLSTAVKNTDDLGYTGVQPSEDMPSPFKVEEARPPISGDSYQPKSAVPVEGKVGPNEQIANTGANSKLTPKEAIQRWAWGRGAGAKTRGDLAGKSFSDLADESLIDKYETGSREGRLADVEKYHSEKLTKGREAGIFGDEQEHPNYLRLDYADDPAKVSSTINTYVGKNPSIAKTRKIATHAQARELGLNPKNKTISDAISSYETKFNRALKDKELYDYLTETNQLKPGKFVRSSSPATWDITGPNQEEIRGLIHNVLTDRPSLANRVTKQVADFVSKTKNIYLAGGMPGTKYNMHAYNVARGDIKLAGFMKGVQELFSNPLGADIEAVVKEHANDLADLVDHGYTYHPVEDFGKATALLAENPTNPAMKLIKGAGNAMEATFEKPLFEKSLPALKLKRTVEVLNKLEASGMERPQALREAAKIGNEFYGGINKALRNKSNNNDMARIFFLAPDWLESRVRLAVGDYKGLARTIVGKGDEVAKIHAKSALRGQATGAGTLAAGYGLGKGVDQFRKDKSSDALTIQAGEDDKGKKREIQTFGTSDEGVRVPLETTLKALQGNPTGLVDMLITSRLSLPFKVATNVIRGQDDFGNPTKGQDKYGKPISGKDATFNQLWELSRPLQMQAIQGMFRYVNGEASLEEAISTGLELPIKYSKPATEKRPSRSAPRVRRAN